MENTSLTLLNRLTWLAFNRVAIHGERPDVVAKEMGLSLNAVFVAKSRVLSKLREDAAGFVGNSSIIS